MGGCAEPVTDPGLIPTPARWDGRHRDAPAWSAALLVSLRSTGAPLLRSRPADRAAFCPRHDHLSPEERAAVWLMLFSAVAELESGFRPGHTHRESFTDDFGRPVISRGLLQTSFESTRHYDCDHASAEDTHNPVRNLSCGVRIMTHHVEREGRIGGTPATPASGGGAYWAVLRPGHRERPLERIQARTAAHPLCRPAPAGR
ncbi:transglycosylase SLT domain-containing protein [Muricoccus radiodurans]|uniref:transglycosylase SLT domain-containing protein n=1 Tax=Muricoccus radiodurans TaxID=2231721 RepID=UPI003CF506C3